MLSPFGITVLGTFTITCGLFGLLGMTFLFPLLAAVVWRRSQIPHRTPVWPGQSLPRSVDVLIPVHNEEATLDKTLQSISEALKFLHEILPEINCSIIVGLDGCQDNTRTLAVSGGAVIIESATLRGKWQTLQALTAKSSADWVVLSDANIRWPNDLLLRLIPAMMNPEVLGVAPSYRLTSRGFWNYFWTLESSIKYLESRYANGPVSVHGATVAYRRSALGRVFASLGDRQWLNDDVVIPLRMRELFPSKKIQYLTNVTVVDGVQTDDSINEFHRRKRLVVGNLQWVLGLFPNLLFSQPAIALVALRRVFRVFWAYWALALVGGTLGLLGLAVSYFVILSWLMTLCWAGAVAFFCLPPLRGLITQWLDPVRASLFSVFYFWTLPRAERTAWK